jgi:hypothetical protein
VPVPGGAQTAQHGLHLGDRLLRPGRRGGARRVGERRPRSAQVPDRRDELVLPAGRGLAGALAVAGAVGHVLPARGAHGIRPGIGGRVDREPQPAPAGARVPDPGRVLRGHACQGFLQQRVIDHVVICDPAAGLRAVGKRRQRGRQQGEKLLVVDPPSRNRVIQGAVAAGVFMSSADIGSDRGPFRDLDDLGYDAEGERFRKARGESSDTDTGRVGSKRKPAGGEEEVDE